VVSVAFVVRWQWLHYWRICPKCLTDIPWCLLDLAQSFRIIWNSKHRVAQKTVNRKKRKEKKCAN
jgi:hypothetical protein